MAKKIAITLVAIITFVAVLGLITSFARAEEPLERIAFGSCARQHEPQPIWDAVVALKPQRFLFIGDNIYGDTDNSEILRQKYAQFGALPEFQRLVKACPIMATPG